MAGITAGRIDFPLDTVPGKVVTQVNQHAIRTISQFSGWLDLDFGGMTVVTE